MARQLRQDTEAIGSDSFLDVVTNIVGILIILVMVVGIRVKNSPPESPTNDAAIKRQLAQLASEAGSLEGDVLGLEQQVQAVTISAQAKYQERGTLAYLLAEHERELDEAKKKLSAENQASFDVRRAVAAAESDLNKLAGEKAEAAKPKKRTPIQIKSYPTPISHTVFGNEVHFQLRNGRLAFAPLEEMNALCSDAARAQIHRLETGGEISGAVGPRQGFEARYYVEPIDMGDGRIQGDFSFEMAPISSNLGETVDVALLPNSRFRARLADYLPRQSTVTLWTYGDSFKDYARVKEALYQLGYNVAARPMPDDVNIGGSAHGSHSAAQ